MSSQIALVANEPQRTHGSERVRRSGSDDVLRAGAEQVKQPASQPVATPVAIVEAGKPVEVEAPELEAAVENIRDFVSDVRRELQFSVDEDSGRTIITVIDSDSGEIIRQIPPEEVMQIAKSVADGAFNLIDSQA